MNKPHKAEDFTAIPVIVTLDQLRPGHEYPGGSVNSRTAYRDHDIEQLAHSLMPENDGQLKPLLCCTHPSEKNAFFVFDGGRRRSAFAFALDKKLIDKSHPIEIKDFGSISPEIAMQLSWAANEQVPLHPADRYAVFAKLHRDDGLSPGEIAKQRGMTTRAVEQSLAFGSRLAPEALDAWRTGEITADLAKIFTLAPSFDDQVEELTKQRKKGGGRKEWAQGYRVEEELRKAFTGNEETTKRFLKFVGEAAYIEAGGRLSKDLFADKPVDLVQDFSKLAKLARAKLKVKADFLVAEGWSWVEIQTASHFADYRYGKSKDKKKAGAVVRIAGTKIEVKTGLVKNGAAGDGTVARNTIPAKPSEPPAMGRGAMDALFDAQERAAGAVLKGSAQLSLAALAASIAVGRRGYGGTGPLAMDLCDARDDVKMTAGAKHWREAFAKFAKLDVKALATLLAAVMPDLVRFGQDDKHDDAALVAALDQKAIAKETAAGFDAKAFFADCSKKFLLSIIADVLGDEEKRRQDSKEQATLAKFCVDSVMPKGWLPEQLRNKAYAGPKGAAKPAATPAQKKAAKKK